MVSTANNTVFQLEQLTQGQADLSRVLDSVMDAMHNKTGAVARHLVDTCHVLRKHKMQVSLALGMAGQDSEAREYLARLHQLRRDVTTRLSLISIQPDLVLGEEFETLCWETLACGVIWLDNIHQITQASNQAASLAGERWALIREGQSTSNAMSTGTEQRQDAQDFDIDQFLYCSLAHEPMDEAALNALTQNAAAMNRLDHITGMLMYADGVFVQLIEGPREALNALWVRLLNDKRHEGVVQLYHRREVESRACEAWSMRLVERQAVQAIIHEARNEITQGRKTAWGPAIERMDELLSHSDWGLMARDLQAKN